MYNRDVFKSVDVGGVSIRVTDVFLQKNGHTGLLCKVDDDVVSVTRVAYRFVINGKKVYHGAVRTMLCHLSNEAAFVLGAR